MAWSGQSGSLGLDWQGLYSVDFLSYSGFSGILDSDRKQNTAYAGARGRENCCTFH